MSILAQSKTRRVPRCAARAKPAVPVDRWNWQRLIAQPYGPGNVVTRAVLFIISTHMDPDGSNGFPSQKHIAEDAGLSERAVREHLDVASREGWVRITTKGKNGKGWALHQYHPVIPKKCAEQLPKYGAERGAAPSKDGAERHAHGAERGAGMVRHVVPPTLTNDSYQILLEPDAVKTASKNQERMKQLISGYLAMGYPKEIAERQAAGQHAAERARSAA